jgi:hypothetical protein
VEDTKHWDKSQPGPNSFQAKCTKNSEPNVSTRNDLLLGGEDGKFAQYTEVRRR